MVNEKRLCTVVTEHVVIAHTLECGDFPIAIGTDLRELGLILENSREA